MAKIEEEEEEEGEEEEEEEEEVKKNYHLVERPRTALAIISIAVNPPPSFVASDGHGL